MKNIIEEFFIGCKTNDLAVVRQWFHAGNAETNNSGLLMALYQHNIETVQFLIENMPNKQNKFIRNGIVNGSFASKVAALNNLNVIDTLIAKAHTIDDPTEYLVVYWESFLAAAVKINQQSLVRELFMRLHERNSEFLEPFLMNERGEGVMLFVETEGFQYLMDLNTTFEEQKNLTTAVSLNHIEAVDRKRKL